MPTRQDVGIQYYPNKVTFVQTGTQQPGHHIFNDNFVIERTASDCVSVVNLPTDTVLFQKFHESGILVVNVF